MSRWVEHNGERRLLTEAGMWDEVKHPRGSGGRFDEVLGKLKGLDEMGHDKVHGVTVMKFKGKYMAGGERGTVHENYRPTSDVTSMAKEITGRLDKADADAREHAAREHAAEEAVRPLSHDQAMAFASDWAHRGDVQHDLVDEMLHQVTDNPGEAHSYVKRVLTQPMTDARRAEAHDLLAKVQGWDRGVGPEGRAARDRGASSVTIDAADTRDRLRALPRGERYGLHGPGGQIGEVERTGDGWTVRGPDRERDDRQHDSVASAAGHATRLQRAASATGTSMARNWGWRREVDAMNARQASRSQREAEREERLAAEGR